MKRELRRVPDEKYLGGVAAGIAYRFGIPTVAVRFAWLLTLMSLPSSGVGAAIYILLWIFLPSWKTTPEDYDRLAGRGKLALMAETCDKIEKYNMHYKVLSLSNILAVVLVYFGFTVIHEGGYYSSRHRYQMIPKEDASWVGSLLIVFGLIVIVSNFFVRKNRRMETKGNSQE